MSETQTSARARGVEDGSQITLDDLPDALSRAPFIYADGATQVFLTDGTTVYTESGARTFGTWGVDERGRFWSSWPPNYRAEYDALWIADSGQAVGVRFVERRRGGTSDGRYVLE